MLVVSAFESWLNELVKTPMHPDLELGLADRPIKCKYKGLSKLLNNDNECWCPDLDLVIELRNEIVHYKPRAVEAEGHVPPWFLPLHQKGLFVTQQSAEFPDYDCTLDYKLGSYRLACWVCQTVDIGVDRLLGVLAPAWAQVLRPSVSNFGHYRAICSPAQATTDR